MSGNSLYDPDQSALDTRWIEPWSEAFRVSEVQGCNNFVVVSPRHLHRQGVITFYNCWPMQNVSTAGNVSSLASYHQTSMHWQYFDLVYFHHHHHRNTGFDACFGKRFSGKQTLTDNRRSATSD